jgi:tetratricopeptide (TPR) repeat protein
MAGDAQRFDKSMDQGHNAAWDQMWEQAAQFYQQALDEFPNNPKAISSMALACFELGEYERALTFYKRCVALSPDDPIPMEKVADIFQLTGQENFAIDAYMRSAELYLKNRDVEKGMNLWGKVIGLNPEHLLAHSRLALVYERLGKKTESVKAYLAVASLLQHSGEVTKAIQAATHALQVYPESPDVQQAISMLQTGRLLPRPGQGKKVTGPIQKPTPRLEKSKKPKIDQPEFDLVAETRQQALSKLASLVFDQLEAEPEAKSERRGLQELVRGTGFLTDGSTDPIKVMLHLSQAVEYQTKKQDAPTIEELERATEAGLDHAAAYFMLGVLQNELGRSELALRNLQRAVNNPEFALGSRLLLGKILLQMERVHDASIELLEALKLADSRVVPADYSEALSQMYDPIIEAQAQEQSDQVSHQICTNILGLLMRVDWQESLKKARQQLPTPMEDGIPVPLADVLTQTSSSQIVESVNRIHQLRRAGKYRTAMEEAFYALQLAPTYLPLHIMLAELQLQQKQNAEAMEKYQVIARCYSVRGEASRAIGLYRQVINLAPLNVGAHNKLIAMLRASGKTEEAIEEYANMADVFYSLADRANARQSYEQAMSLAMQDNVAKDIKINILQKIADLDLQSLDWRLALKSFEHIRNMKPQDETVRMTLVDLFYRLGQDSRAATEMRNYVGILLEYKDFDKAVSFLEEMVKIYPKQPAILRFLAEIYRRTGKTSEAVTTLESATELFLERNEISATIETVMAILALNPPNVAEYQKLLAELKGEK